MKNLTQDNWYKWGYGGEHFNRQTSDLPLVTEYSRFHGTIGTMKEEMEKAAKSTLDCYPNLQPCIFFSGGVDSELMVRTYQNIGANPKIYIARYENDYNLYDVSYAVTVCNSLGLDYQIIDFNLQQFYERDALQVSEDAQIDRPRMLPHLKFTDEAEGLIICGFSDITWYRPSTDYTQKFEWLAKDFEHDLSTDKYNILHNRDAIFQWFKWSPGLVLSYTKLDWFKRLVNDQYEGKLGVNSTKLEGFREVFPDIIARKKQTGFERIDHLIDEVEAEILKRNGGIRYRQSVDRTLVQLEKEILG